NRCGCRVGRNCRGAASRRDDHGYAPADNIPRQRYEPIGLTIRGAEINCHIPAFDVTGVFQGLAECRHQVRVKRLAVEKSDQRHRWLRPRRERPRDRAAEQSDELAPFHGGYPRPTDHELRIAGLEWISERASQQKAVPWSESGQSRRIRTFATLLACPLCLQ